MVIKKRFYILLIDQTNILGRKDSSYVINITYSIISSRIKELIQSNRKILILTKQIIVIILT